VAEMPEPSFEPGETRLEMRLVGKGEIQVNVAVR
jgi:hypothetical protein